MRRSDTSRVAGAHCSLYLLQSLIHRQGLKKFIDTAVRAGVDGLLVLDLPPEESENYEQLMAQAGMCNIYLIAPTTPTIASS